MKKTFTTTVLTTVLCTAMAAIASGIVSSDTDGDGKVTTDDASLIYDYILGTSSEYVTLEQVDVNGDGKANTADVVEVFRTIREKGLDIDYIPVGGSEIKPSASPEQREQQERPV